MAPRDGSLGLLDIGAIFVVVFALLFAGVQYSNGNLLPKDTTNESEERLRDAVWAELNERRTVRDLRSMPRDQNAEDIAQSTTDELIGELPPDASHGDQAFGSRPLPNVRLLCTQVPAGVPVSNVSTRPDEATVDRLADALVAADRNDVLFRPRSRFRAGMGIAIHEGGAYAVYRSCEQADT